MSSCVWVIECVRVYVCVFDSSAAAALPLRCQTITVSRRFPFTIFRFVVISG